LIFSQKKVNLKIMTSDKNIKIGVAMSGGVDSSVTAALLKKQGFDVVGIFMKFWKDGQSSENRCCSVESEKLARLVAKEIGIPFYVLNVEKEFKKKVVDYFLKEYKKGNTPNPCVVCNKEIKFGFLIKKALSLGADFVATGHYAQIKNGRLFKGKDDAKDQAYFLWQLNQDQLKHVLFPVGEYIKPEVRKLAKKFKLPTAETPESQEVCFIKNTTADFLKKYLKTKSGKIIASVPRGQASLANERDETGKVLGEHQGLWFYTIGQRKSLEVPQGPWYVVNKDFKNNVLIVSRDLKDLNRKELVASNINWINPQKLPLNAEVKIRYKAEPVKAKITSIDKNPLASLRASKVKVIFAKSQRAITPGQSVVFYKGKELLGGGVIE
jgi:tRNA-uridine 2-sulfurtransferase